MHFLPPFLRASVVQWSDCTTPGSARKDGSGIQDEWTGNEFREAILNRRELLLGTGLAAGSGFISAAPAIAKGGRELSMVTDWPEPSGLFDMSQRLASAINEASDGRITITVHPSGAMVRSLETMDAVQAGVADMFHTHVGYYAQHSQALHFFSGVPYGLTADEIFAWVRFGGGQALWDKIGEALSFKPLLCCSTGAQLGGWFREELNGVASLKGLRYRMAGLGADVYRELGVAVLQLPPAEITQALRSGAIDACEWAGPWLDMSMGLHEAADHYYYPGWHEPGGAITLGINQRVWGSLNNSDRGLLDSVAAGEYLTSLSEFNVNNANALQLLRSNNTVKFHKFDDAMIKNFAAISKDVVREAGSADANSRAVYESFISFRQSIRDWTSIGEGAYRDAYRSLESP